MNDMLPLVENKIARTRSVRRKRLHYKRSIQLFLVVLLYIGVFLMTLYTRAGNNSETVSKPGDRNGSGRKLLWWQKRDTNSSSQQEEDVIEDEKNCTPRSVEEFPDNFFDYEMTTNGGLAVNIVIALYMFAVQAIVCDDYFVASLERLCEDINLQEDVAGATFMAAGSSSPEFATSVVGVFIAKSDVGIGTAIGSDIFNTLFIIGSVGVFAGQVIQLTWWPLFRDSTFFICTIAVFVVVIYDKYVHWYEAVLMVAMYMLYIGIMVFNRRLERCTKRLLRRWRRRHKRQKGFEEQQLTESNKVENGVIPNRKEKTNPDENENEEKTPLIDSRQDDYKTEKGYESPLVFPKSLIRRIIYVIMFPARLLMYFTIPDCRRPGRWRRFYMATFLMAIVWIAGASYVMVWFLTITGDALGIPDTAMGLTVLAAGTSVPDLLSSIFVARDGFGDMAVSNSIGSNIFDILMCLGVPWLLETAVVHTGQALIVHSGDTMAFTGFLLLGTIIFVISGIVISRWKMTKCFGLTCMFTYAVVITFSCLFEMNVFGDFNQNKPLCPRQNK